MTIAFTAPWESRFGELRISSGMTPGWCFVDAQRLTSISDPEMDMNRAVAYRPRVRMRRLVAAFRWLTPGLYTMETPRRSVDRELEQFSSPWE
jgi:hypothetical protein